MFKSLIKGGLIGGIVVFIWTMISWMVVPWHQATFNSFENEAYVASVIKENAKKQGVYIMPSMCNKDETKEQQYEKIRKGPYMVAAVSPDGAEPMSARHFIMSFVTQFIAGAFIGMILYLSCCYNYFGRVIITLFAGIFAAVISGFPLWNWWGYPWCYVIVQMLDMIIGWLIAGFFIAWTIKPKKHCCHKGENDIPPPAT